MMKRVLPYFLIVATFVPISFAGTVSYLGDGDYTYSAWLENDDELYVVGGGAYEIVAKDYSYVEVQYTSKTLGIDVGGIMDLIIDDYAQLLYMDGVAEELTIYDDATAILKGGRIDYITSYQVVNNSPHITIICQPDWEWMYNSSNEIKGITGLWKDGISFDIEFFDQTDKGCDPVWENINVIPEPATLVLLGLGGLLIRRRK